jgi:amidase
VLARTQRHNRELAKWWTDFDLLLTPTLAMPPVPLGLLAAPGDDPLEPLYRMGAVSPFTGSFNLTGQPAVSLPLHWNADGLPIGVQLVAAYGEDAVLLRVASQLEAANPWRNRRPPISA